MSGAQGPSTRSQRSSGILPASVESFSGSRCACARVMSETQSPPCLAVWWGERKGPAHFGRPI
eukprot:11164884-Lingulodinium_polyedra.AAC.1